jgi:hypothetical protein
VFEVHRVAAIAKRKSSASAAHLTHAIVTVVRMTPAQRQEHRATSWNSYEFASHGASRDLETLVSLACGSQILHPPVDLKPANGLSCDRDIGSERTAP